MTNQRMEQPPPESGSGRRFAVQLSMWLGLAVLASLLIFAIRLFSVVRYSDLFETTGAEAPCFYNIWKVQHGFPVFEWANRPPYTLATYNFGFYRLYGQILSWLGVADAGILIWGRVLTFMLAAAGCVVQWLVIRRLAGRQPGRPAALVLLSMVVLNWFGASTTVWWPLTVRPDMGALCFVCLGLLFVLLGLERARPGYQLAASLAFFAAWSFKQSVVATMAGCALYLLFARQWRAFAALAVPFGLGSVAALWIGGKVYIHNVLYMAGMPPLLLREGVRNLLEAMGPNPLLWGGLVFLPMALWWRREGKPEGAESDKRRLMLVVFGVTLLAGVVSVFKEGASRNHLFEAMTHGTSLCALVLLALLDGSRRGMGVVRARWVVLALAAMMNVMPLATLLFPKGLGGPFHWNLVFATREAREQRMRVVAALSSAPRPLLIVDGVLAQPWHSTGDRYPAVVLDTASFPIAKRKGIIPATALEDMVREGRFAAVVAQVGSDLARAAEERGYSGRPIPPVDPSEERPGDWACYSKASASPSGGSPPLRSQVTNLSLAYKSRCML